MLLVVKTKKFENDYIRLALTNPNTFRSLSIIKSKLNLNFSGCLKNNLHQLIISCRALKLPIFKIHNLCKSSESLTKLCFY